MKVGKQKNYELEETIQSIDREYKGLEISRHSPSRRIHTGPVSAFDERVTVQMKSIDNFAYSVQVQEDTTKDLLLSESCARRVN